MRKTMATKMMRVRMKAMAIRAMKKRVMGRMQRFQPDLETKKR